VAHVAPPGRPTLPVRARVVRDSRVLVLLAHPSLHRSRVNRQLAAAARAIPGVTVHDLYEAYPDHDVDVAHEQALLIHHPVIVLQHPFYWYSTPSLLKQWQDLVLEFGWAYGPEGTALRGKTMLSAISTGGPEEAYRPEGFNRYTIKQLLAPMDQTAHLCGITYLPPFVLHGSHRVTDSEIHAGAVRYIQVLEALRDERLDPAAVADLPRLNADFGWLEGS
jgi:glutathione-regulated potassium-efflux system ancillary protein KefG